MRTKMAVFVAAFGLLVAAAPTRRASRVFRGIRPRQADQGDRGRDESRVDEPAHLVLHRRQGRKDRQGHQLGLGNGQPERADAPRLDAQLAEDRRRRDGRGQHGEGRQQQRQRQHRRPGEHRQEDVRRLERRSRPTRRLDARGEILCEATRSSRSPPQSGPLPCCRCRPIRMFRPRRRPAEAPRPSRRRRRRGLPDGTVNLGRVPGEKGVWDLPYITNMGARVIDPATGKPFPSSPTSVPAGKPVGGRGGAPAEPFVPFQPWAAAMYNYNTMNSSKYDPEGLLPPAGRPAPCSRRRTRPNSSRCPTSRASSSCSRAARTSGGKSTWTAARIPTGDALPLTWLGHSVGKWEGDTLVVDVVGFHEGTWLDYLRPSAYRQASCRGKVLAAEQGNAALRSAHRRSRAPTPSRSQLRGTSISTRPTSSPSTSARRTTGSCSG